MDLNLNPNRQRLNLPQPSSPTPKLEESHAPKAKPSVQSAKPACVYIPSPNYGERPGGPKDIDTIVLHHTGTKNSAQDVAAGFQNPRAEVSAHYTIGKDGTIVQSVTDDKKAWHAGPSVFKGRERVNDFSLGIEIVNLGDNQDPYPDAQYEALIDLVTWMCKTYDVPLDRITGHRDVIVPKGLKVDPSDNFDWDRVRQGVESRLYPKSPSFWQKLKGVD
ncbi:MAG: N-acetylmuramoyl-L-alanine amidase [Bacteroidota bacterium]